MSRITSSRSCTAAHLAFDEERLKDALGFLDELNEQYFRDLDQYWRVLKSEELKICCQIRLGRLDALDSLPAWVQACEEYETADPLGGAAAPTELMRTVVSEAAGDRIPCERLRDDVLPLLRRLLATQEITNAFEAELGELADKADAT